MTRHAKSPDRDADASVSKRRMKSEGRSKEAIGERLEIIRTVKGLTQKDFALAAGVNENTYSQYKNGIQSPDLEQANKLCDAWGITLDWIYRGDNGGLPPELRDAIKVVRQARSTKPRKTSAN